MKSKNIGSAFNLIVLRCNNITTTKNFYNKLGLNFIEEQHGNSPIHYACNLNGLVIELYPATESLPADSCRLGFSLDNFSTLSISLNAEIKQREGISFFVVVDPDGRKVEITD